MSELSAQQLHDLMQPLWEREPGLQADGIHVIQSPGVEGLCFSLNDITVTQLCESQMARWLLEQKGVRWYPAKCAYGSGYYITATNDYNPKMFYNGSDQFAAPTLVQALAAACSAVLEAKESNDE